MAQSSLEIEGLENLAEMGKLLREFNDKTLKRAVSNHIREAGRVAGEEAKANALQVLPKHGGLNKSIGAARVTVRTTTSGRNLGVKVTATKKGRLLGAIDQGFVRHPVFGDRQDWKVQSVPPGWWSDAIRKVEPQLQKAVATAVAEALDKLKSDFRTQ